LVQAVPVPKRTSIVLCLFGAVNGRFASAINGRILAGSHGSKRRQFKWVKG
jgi:hypothetical protein